LIDIQKDSLENIYNKHRAFFLWPKIWFTHKDKRFIIEKIIINNENYEDRKNQALILDNNINPAIQEIKIKPEGKKAITGKDFLQ
jgi:methionyl-tRNA formyltransferase